MVNGEEVEDTKGSPVVVAKKRKLPPDDYCWSADAFPAQHIKSVLQEEDGVGMLLKPAIDLVGACSAIFVRNLLTYAATTTAIGEGNGKVAAASAHSATPVLLTLEGLRQTIAQNEQFQFLEGVLDDLEEEEDAATKSTSLLMSDVRSNKTTQKKSSVPKKPKKSVAKGATNSSAIVKEALQVVGDETFAFATARQAKIIVADEEDYD